MEKSEIIVLFDEWNGALQTGDPKKVAALYAADAILLPTEGRITNIIALFLKLKAAIGATLKKAPIKPRERPLSSGSFAD